jgi:hypothetical protein
MNHIPKRHELERAHGVTWGQLTELEPRLSELLWKARQDGAHCRCREEVSRVFVPFRSAVAELLGFQGRHRDHPILGSVGAYEVAYWRFYDAVAGLLPKPFVDVSYAGEPAVLGQQRYPAATARKEAFWGGLVEVH